MPIRLVLAGLCLAFPLAARADHAACPEATCALAYTLTSTSATRSYALLIAAPESGCRKVRFRVEDAGHGFLGHTPPMEPGDLAVVRVGRGYAAGDHALLIEAVGCAARPAATRRVTLAKRSPDHGWRGAD